MIDISYLYSGFRAQSVSHRYGDSSKPDLEMPAFKTPKSAAERRPIVVWNITRSCNLKCIHCYSDSEHKRYTGELTTDEAKQVIDDLAQFEVPVLLFSGGEPLMRRDLFDLVTYAHEKGLRTVLSSNGTVITESVAQEIKDIGFSYVGISLDGIGSIHDYFRGVPGSFNKTMQAIRNLIAVGQKTGLRLTLTSHTIDQIDSLFDLAIREGIKRICFYHLVPSGRGKEIFQMDLAKTRQGVDRILERTAELFKQGTPLEILTVDNHADGPYLYLKLKANGDARAEDVYKKLVWNGGGLHSSGTGIACIDSQGNVHPDQFWTHYCLGNVREKKFTQIWSREPDVLLTKLRNRKDHIHGRCQKCQFFECCGGALRVRADIAEGDPWVSDPACYLTDQEIGIHG